MRLPEAAAVGILGGSFDPIHNGHLAIAELASEHFQLKRIVFIPASIPPHKPDTVRASARDRLAMLRLAIKGNDSFAAWDAELRRPGKSYTVDTLGLLRRRYPQQELFFIIGSDNLKEIASWHRYETILSMTTLCVTHRPGYSMRIPAAIKGARIRTFPSPDLGVSSSEIRGLLQHGHTCRYLVPARVLQYIAARRLYV
jgi:nicotinate-nucleotide adenylyltransferase